MTGAFTLGDSFNSEVWLELIAVLPRFRLELVVILLGYEDVREC